MSLSMEQQQLLCKFAVRILASAWNDELDGEEAQEIALGLGLLKEDKADHMDCDHGFEGDVGDLIYRTVSWLEPTHQQGQAQVFQE